MGILALDDDLPLADAMMTELALVWGPDALHWSLINNRHPLYGEVSRGFEYQLPVYLPGVIFKGVEADSTSLDPSEEGMRRRLDATIYLGRQLLEQNGGVEPKEGDVITLWSSKSTEHHRQRVRHFDVVFAAPSDPVGSSSTPLSYKCDCVLRSEFPPMERLGP